MNIDVAVAGIPLVVIVIGLVEWIKKTGATGKVLIYVSMLIGLVLGVAYQVSLAVPTTFAGWFGAIIYGIALGLVASGIYDAVKGVINPSSE